MLLSGQYFFGAQMYSNVQKNKKRKTLLVCSKLVSTATNTSSQKHTRGAAAQVSANIVSMLSKRWTDSLCLSGKEALFFLWLISADWQLHLDDPRNTAVMCQSSHCIRTIRVTRYFLHRRVWKEWGIFKKKKRKKLKKKKFSPLHADANRCWHTCWASWCQMSVRCSRGREVRTPSVTTFTGNLLQGLKGKQKKQNKSGHEEWAHDSKPTQPVPMPSRAHRAFSAKRQSK